MAGRRQTRAELVFAALGGIGEIGMNAYLYGYGPSEDRQWLMVDLGITFPGEFEPGVDVILPDITFIEEERQSLVGLVLTHAHEDHFGAVIELWPRLRVPIYATPFTAALLRAKLAENGRKELPIKVIKPKGRISLGPFDIELVDVAHSIPETNALAIRTPLGMILHSADWKLDATPVAGAATDEARLQALGEEGVLALICDSTNALREGISPSEADVGATLKQVIAEQTGAIAVTTFASNVARLRSIAEAAEAAGRELVVAGRAMHRVLTVAAETGYLPKRFRFHDQQVFEDIPRSKVLALVTGSQGEPRAALARIALGEHPDIKLGPGDTAIFSSRTIPGNEKAVGRIQNALADQKVKLITDADALVHVTGHPRRGELKRIYAWCRPRVAVPMHGEARHIEEHVRLARASGVPECLGIRNGQLLRLAPGPAEIVDRLPTGRLYRDGSILVPAETGPVADRRKLSYVGIVTIAVVLSRSGEIEADPIVALEGIPTETADGRPMDEEVLSAVDGALESIPKARRKDAELVRDALYRAARSAVASVWGKKPVCKVLISVI